MLLDEMKRRMRCERGRWREVATKSGVSYGWLKSVMTGKIKNPGVNSVEAVLEVLNDEDGRVRRGDVGA